MPLPQNPSQLSDGQLLDYIRGGNKSAFEYLFKRYYHPLCNFAFQYVRDIRYTEEIVSDIFTKIWQKRDTLEIKSCIKAYLFTATRNQALNFLRKEKQDHLNLEDHKDKLRNKDEKLKPDYSLRDRESNNELESLIQAMPPRRAQIFRLSRVEGFTYSQIAEILSISPRTVQNHMVKAVKQLKDLLVEK